MRFKLSPERHRRLASESGTGSLTTKTGQIRDTANRLEPNQTLAKVPPREDGTSRARLPLTR